MSKLNREEEIFHLGANATRKAYQQGLSDFNDLIIRLEKMKGFGFIERYSFERHVLWITTSRVITNEQWNSGLEEIHELLDSMTPKKEIITPLNVRNLRKGDHVLFPNKNKGEFVKWSWIDRDCAVFSGLSHNRIHVESLLGATCIPKHLTKGGL